MSLLKNILKPFVEFEEERTGAPGQKNTPPAAEAKSVPPKVQAPAAPSATVDHTVPEPPVNIPTPQNPVTAQSGPAVALPEHQAYFEHLIEDANAKNPFFQGADFKEFIDSKRDIDTIADEETKYKTAFSVLKRTGLTKERLLSTGQEYLNLIGRALNTFQGAYAQQYTKEVRSREQQIQKKAEEIQALNDKINALKGEMKKISDEITQSKGKLDASRNSFIIAGENKQQEIHSELQKIEQYFQ